MATELCNRCTICDVCDVKDIVDQPPRCQNFVARPMTNYDKLRAMNVEEMAEFFTQFYYDGPKFYCPVQPVIGEGECAMRSDCRQCWLRWLNEVCTAEKEGEQQNNAD